MSESAFADGRWTSADGLTLHFRDYAGPADKPPVICIPGLTRNARDFEALAAALAGSWRVLALDLRGRGESDYAKDSASYNPLQYVADIEALLAEQQIARFVAVGTSLGGIITMLLALGGANRLAGAVLNDIGPAIEPAGLARIRDYVGQGRSFPTWMHAARALKDSSSAIFPDYAVTDWLRTAKRLMTVSGNGRIVFDYDMKIAEPIIEAGEAPPAELWPAWQALAGRPVLALRGELSDLLSAGTFARMERELPGAKFVTVPRVGHAPSLDEPEARAAIAEVLGEVA